MHEHAGGLLGEGPLMSHTWGSQVVGLRGTCYRAVRKSVMSTRRGMREVPSEISVKKICYIVKLVGAS